MNFSLDQGIMIVNFILRIIVIIQKHMKIMRTCRPGSIDWCLLTLTVLVATIDTQWEGMGDVGSARYESALLPPCPTIRVLSYSN